MVDILYSVISLMIFIFMSILYAYSLKSIKNEKQRKRQRRLFGANAVFCAIDTMWGLAAAGMVKNAVAFNMLSMMFFIVTSFTIYTWVITSLIYLNCRLDRFRKVSLVTPVILQILIVIFNPIYHFVYQIDPKNWHYIAGKGQTVLFVINIMHLFIIVHAAARKISISQDKFIKGRYITVIVYTLVLAAFCLFQNVFPKAPFFAMGCMIAATIIFTKNIVLDEKKVLLDTSNYYQSTTKEMYNTLEALSSSYVSIHVFDLVENKQQPIRSNTYINDLTTPGATGSEQIRNVMENITLPEYKDIMVEFVDLSTLPERMKGKEKIYQEFMGRNFGWCISAFIRVSSDEYGNPTTVIHAVQDINEVKKKEIEYDKVIKEALKSQNTIFEEMLRAQNNGVLAIEEDGKVIYSNDAGAKLMGYYDANNFPANIKICFENIDIDDRDAFNEKIQNLKKNHKDFEQDYCVTKDGKKMYISGYTKQFRLSDGRNIFIISLSDITRNKHVEAELKVLSETDALTQIDNRRSGESKIEAMMANGTSGMLCIIDVNKFKGINDTYGHQTGDIVLQKVAESIKGSFRDTDVVMRLGGDEFAVYAKELLNTSVCANCMDKLFKRIDEIKIEGCEKLKPTLSVGIAFFESNSGCSYSRLYQQADSVMYMSKSKGGNNYTVFKKIK